MNPVSGVVTFIIIWWVVIFCVLPIGISTTQEKAEEGEYLAPGAPKSFNMKKKLLITTLISALIWVAIYLLVISDIISFRDIADHME